MKKISLVIPVFNEAETIDHFFRLLDPELAAIKGVEFEFIFVNDGSTDSTLELLVRRSGQDSRISVVDFSRNFGKEAALTAGIDAAQGDAVIPIDVDLQDPPELIARMIEQWRSGAEVVCARRIDRASDSFLKRLTASWFYRIHNSVADSEIPQNVGDFRLMDRVVVEALKQLPERRRFMKGLFAWVGFKTSTIDYSRQPRIAGNSKFSGWKLWNLALEGITSFSTVPLRIWTYIGLGVSCAAFIYMSYIILHTLMSGIAVPGYASLLAVVLFLGGIQLIGIGVLGEYIGRIYMEVKGRPTYIVNKRYRKGHSE